MVKSINSQIAPLVLEIVAQSVQSIKFGLLALTVQDGKVVQMERTEKFQVTGSATPTPGLNLKSEEVKRISDKILDGLVGLQYGQIIVKFTDGRVTQVEKTEKRRYADWMGVNGEGI